MPRDGAGTYSVPYPDFIPGTIIDQAQMDANFADIAAALTQSLTRNGESVPTQALPMGGRNHTNVGDATLASQYASAGQIQTSAITWCGTTAGTGSAYTATMSPAFTGAYVVGMRVQFRVHAVNVAGPTLNVNSLGAKAIRTMSNGAQTALPAGLLTIGSVVEVAFVDDGWMLLSPVALGPGFYDIAQSVNASVQATVVFALPSAFSTFQLRISDCAPTIAAAPYLRFSYDGGVSYTASPFDYGHTFSTVASGTSTPTTATSSFCQLGGTAGSTLFGTVDITPGNPTRGTFALTTYQPGPLLSYSSGGFNGPAATASHVQFGFVGQNILAHRIKLLGAAA